ncbi:hypothetical protein F5879DRAFT_922424 [Lentinula edodes]|nr:hypothetical protein F5879DRAFT_922424 [Lentinula edodes]
MNSQEAATLARNLGSLAIITLYTAVFIAYSERWQDRWAARHLHKMIKFSMPSTPQRASTTAKSSRAVVTAIGVISPENYLLGNSKSERIRNIKPQAVQTHINKSYSPGDVICNYQLESGHIQQAESRQHTKIVPEIITLPP